MSGLSHIHAVIATWDWQAIGACCLGLDLILFGLLAAHWTSAPSQGPRQDG